MVWKRYATIVGSPAEVRLRTYNVGSGSVLFSSRRAYVKNRLSQYYFYKEFPRCSPKSRCTRFTRPNTSRSAADSCMNTVFTVRILQQLRKNSGAFQYYFTFCNAAGAVVHLCSNFTCSILYFVLRLGPVVFDVVRLPPVHVYSTFTCSILYCAVPGPGRFR